MKKIIVFASGGGSNFREIYSSTLNKKIKNAKIELLVSDKPKSGAVFFANRKNIDTLIMDKSFFKNNKFLMIDNLENTMREIGPDLICLAGYMKLLPKRIVEKFVNKIINIHPGPLPEFGGKGFYGIRVHEKIIEMGRKETAVTIHYVNEEYDKGAIIKEKRIKVKDDDSPEILAKRVLTVEHSIYSETINELLYQ